MHDALTLALTHRFVQSILRERFDRRDGGPATWEARPPRPAREVAVTARGRRALRPRPA